MRTVLLLVSFLPTLALAQEPAAQPKAQPAGQPAVGQQAGQPAAATTARGRFGIDFVSQYFFRGLQQENQGIIAQPWVELGYPLVDAGQDLRKLDLTFGLWNSLHDGPTGGSGGIWYESDFYVDVTAGVGERLSLGARYTAYTSPNGTFDPARLRGFRKTVEEIAFTATLDDKALLTDAVERGLQPHATIAFELAGQRDNGNDHGIYLEVGVAPAFAIGQLGSMPLTLTVPATMGLSLGGYYEDQTGGGDELFGYLDIGAVVSAPLDFMPARLGPWQGEVGLHWLLLGDNTEERNDGDPSELILSLGMATRF